MSWRHGTPYGYNEKGCRCAACTEAARADRKASRDRARAENRPSYQRELAASRRLKEGYRGSCETCGKATSGSGGKGRAPKRCHKHAVMLSGLKKRGTGPMQARLLEQLQNGPRRFLELRLVLGVTGSYMGSLLNTCLKYGLIVRISRGLYALPDPVEPALMAKPTP